jgi:hypothetical protein
LAALALICSTGLFFWYVLGEDLARAAGIIRQYYQKVLPLSANRERGI